MSAREWKPGDVAMWKYGQAEQVALRVPGCGHSEHEQGSHWHLELGGWTSHDENVRPLVVIDPTDEGVARRLIDYLGGECDWGFEDESIGDMQAALRSLVSPPRPVEPTGLGAVVEDEQGRQWVRAFQDDDQPWVADHFLPRKYADIESPEVLSEGVTS